MLTLLAHTSRRHSGPILACALCALSVVTAACSDDDACADGACEGAATTTGGDAGLGGAGLVGASSAGGAPAGEGGGSPCDACEGDTPFCDETNECVACLDSTHCDGGHACKPDGTCSQYGTSQAVCDRCDTDLNCDSAHVCVEMTFPTNGGPPVGGFCQPKSSGACGEPRRPYALMKQDEITVDGLTVDICTLAATTCAAINDHDVKKECQSDEACGNAGQTDGLCRLFGEPRSNTPLCTVPCTSDQHCPHDTVCTNGNLPTFCHPL